MQRWIWGLLLAGVIAFGVAWADAPEPDFSFGLIADCQYCGVPGEGVRKYDQSDEKLAACVGHLNTLDLEFVVHLGDFIDRDYESFAVVGPIFDRLRMPGFHVLGNHDYSVDDRYKAQVPSILGMPSRYYAFNYGRYRFLVIDGNDVSFHAQPAETPEYEAVERYYDEHGGGAPKWNGALGDDQLVWLENRLKEAESANDRVIVFCHFPVYPENAHNLWNAEEIAVLLERYPCVVAYINGHNHGGNYAERNGLHYLTLKGMVDTEETAYAVAHVYRDRLEITGYGREPGRVISFRE